MINVEKANLLALKFLVSIDLKADYSYNQARKLMTDYMGGDASIKTEDDEDTLNSALTMAFIQGYKLPVGGVMFRGDAWHDFACAISQHMTRDNYMGYQIVDLTKSLVGVDIDGILNVLLAQRLIKSVPKLTNGRYITVYTKTW